MRQANVSGKGAIFQVSDTKWIAKICLDVDGSGKPIIKQFSGKTEAIAKKKLREFKKTLDYFIVNSILFLRNKKSKDGNEFVAVQYVYCNGY